MAKILVNAALPGFIANVTSMLHSRMAAVGQSLDGPRRDIDAECQYPKNVSDEAYWRMWRREPYAKKVVESYPDEAFSVRPAVYENNKKRLTPFEKGVEAFFNSDLGPLTHLKMLDTRTRVTGTGGMLIGLDDGLGLDKPVASVLADGTTDGTAPRRSVPYLRTYDGTQIRVNSIEGNPSSPRYMQPLTYQILIDDADAYGEVNFVRGQRVTRAGWNDVHWTRIIHGASGVAPGEVNGVSAMEAVYNPLLNLRKVMGGDAEAYFKNVSPGLALSADAGLLEAGTVEVDVESIKKQIQLFMDGLQKFLLLVGLNATSIAPNLTDPTAHVLIQLTAIACALNMPLRVFMGSEEGKLASGQDMKSWGRRVKYYFDNYVTPCLLRPFLLRLIAMGVLPKPKVLDENRKPRFVCEWAGIDVPDEDMKSTVADRMAAAMQKFIAGRCYQMCQPTDFFVALCGIDPDLAQQIVARAKGEPEIDFKEDTPKVGGDTGVAGSPPSDPKPVAVK